MTANMISLLCAQHAMLIARKIATSSRNCFRSAFASMEGFFDTKTLLKRHLRTLHAMTLLEVMLVMALLISVGSLCSFASIRFWRSYQLEQNQAAMGRFLRQVELLATLSQSEIEIQITQYHDGYTLSTQSCLGKRFKLMSASIELPGVDKVEVRLADESMGDQRLICSSSAPAQPLKILLKSGHSLRLFQATYNLQLYPSRMQSDDQQAVKTSSSSQERGNRS